MPVKKETREQAQKANGRIRRQKRGTDVAEAEYLEADAGLLQQAITAVTKRGCAIQFGLTRDAGAYVIRIVGDGEPYNEYIRPTEDIDLHLQGLISDFEAE